MTAASLAFGGVGFASGVMPGYAALTVASGAIVWQSTVSGVAVRAPAPPVGVAEARGAVGELDAAGAAPVQPARRSTARAAGRVRTARRRGAVSMVSIFAAFTLVGDSDRRRRPRKRRATAR